MLGFFFFLHFALESKRRTIPGFLLLRPHNSAATASTNSLPGPSMSVVDAPTVTARPVGSNVWGLALFIPLVKTCLLFSS